MSIPEPAAVTRSLLDLFELRKIDGPEQTFEGTSLPQPGGHVFGGQMMAQALIAMARTVPEGRRVHSTYASFLEPARASEPLTFTVRTLRDGGSFSTRALEVTQRGNLVLTMNGSFQERQEGVHHVDEVASDHSPDTLPSTRDELGRVDHPLAQFMAYQRPVDIRNATGSLYFTPDPEKRAEQAVWMRALTPIDTRDPLPHEAVLTYASDYTPFEPTIRRQGLTWLTPGLRVATLNHSMWFHSDVNVDDWLLYVQRSPAATGGRSLSVGQIYTREGSLVATVNQEGMFRIRTEVKDSDHPAV